MFKFVNKKNRTVAAFLLVCCITVSMLYSTPAYALEVTQTDVKMYTTSGTPDCGISGEICECDCNRNYR